MDGVTPDQIMVDLCITTLKPLQAKWLTQYHNYVRVNQKNILNGWKKAGITQALQNKQRNERPF